MNFLFFPPRNFGVQVTYKTARLISGHLLVIPGNEISFEKRFKLIGGRVKKFVLR